MDMLLVRRFPMGSALFYAAYASLFCCLGGLGAHADRSRVSVGFSIGSICESFS